MMELRQVERSKAKIRMSLQGVSGSGKTYSALLIAYGLTRDWGKIAVIDTENGSADLYAHLGGYKVLQLSSYTPEYYMQAIFSCERSGVEVIIIDSLSHAWEYLLQLHCSMQGSSFTNWGKITPKYNALIQKIQQSPCHIIATMRCKQDYVLTERNGKLAPEKVGLKAIMREGIDYEFTIVMEIDLKHKARVTKDRTELYKERECFTPTEETGQIILKWCNIVGSLKSAEMSNLLSPLENGKEMYHIH